MIPRDYVTEWWSQAPWVQDIQVEQDLVICRALVAIFSHPVLADALAFKHLPMSMSARSWYGRRRNHDDFDRLGTSSAALLSSISSSTVR